MGGVRGFRGALRVNTVVLALALAGCETANDAAPALTLGESENGGGRPPAAARGRSAGGSVTGGRASEELFEGLEQRGTGKFTQDKIGPATTTPRPPVGSEGITLNLLNVPVAQAAKSILGDVLKVNYTIADKVGGTVTIQTASPMHKDAVVEVFESALRINGAALVRSDGHYRIVPAANAPQNGAPISTTRQSGPGTQVRVIPLKFIAPSEMRRIIEPISPRSSILTVDDSRNLLVVSGNDREISDIDRMITLFDVDWMRGMSFAFFPVRSSDPEALTKELETVLGLDKDGPLKGTVRVLPNRRLSSIMVVSSQPGPLDTARKWIAQLDRVAEGSEEQLFVYKIRNRNAAELAGLLSKVLVSKDQGAGQANAGGTVGPRFETGTVSSDPANSSAPEPQSPSGGSQTPGAQPGFTGVRNASTAAPSSGVNGGVVPSFGNGSSGGSQSLGSQTGGSLAAGGGNDSLQSQGAQNGGGGRGQKIVADEPNSAILITATRREYDRIQKILERLDVLPTQVMIEAMIAEVTLNDELKFGVKWALDNHRHQVTFSDVTSGAIKSSFPGFSYFYLTQSITAAIDAVSAITKVNVISAPSLMVLDNRKATLQIGDQVPIVTQSAQGTVAIGGPIINSVALKDTGIILNVVPHVSDGGRVVLEIEQEVSNVTRTTSSGIDSPTIQQRRIRTSVVVDDGAVVALGGLIQERDNKTNSQIPILGDIPVIGAVFRQRTDSISRTELLIFIRPQVIRDAQEARDVTEEFRSRIHLMKPTSMQGRDSYDRNAKRILR